MQKIVAFLLMLSFMGQTFNQGWYYVGYVIQKKEYVKRCINKARPQLKCNGKCQLMMKLKEQEERERGLPPELKLAAKAEVISSRSFFAVYTFTPEKKEKQQFIQLTIGVPVGRSVSLFHPPDVFSMS